MSKPPSEHMIESICTCGTKIARPNRSGGRKRTRDDCQHKAHLQRKRDARLRKKGGQ